MMKKAIILFLVLVLSVGIFAVPTGAEEETGSSYTGSGRPTDEEYQKILDAADRAWEQQQQSIQHLEDLKKQNDYNIASYVWGKTDSKSKNEILDRSWELYNLGQITEKEYWKLYNFLCGTFKDVLDEAFAAFGDKDEKQIESIELIKLKNQYKFNVDIFQEMFRKYLNSSNSFHNLNKDPDLVPTSELATYMLLFESAFGLPTTEDAFQALLDHQTYSIKFDEKTVESFVDQLLLAIKDDAPDEDKDISEVERQQAAVDGGREFADELLDDRINKMYKAMYPFGVAIMLVCWMIGMTRSGLNATFDIKDKDSIARSMIDLVIGIGLLALAPWIIETMTSLGFEMCDRVGIAWRPELYEKNDSGTVHWVIDALGIDTVKDKLLLTLIQGTLVMNVMRIGLMQCLAPLSIGCIAGGDRTKNMAFGWLKEYLKLCLLPAVTAIYICLACAATHTIDNMWLNIVIGLSYFLVPKQLLDKLF